MVFKSSRFIPPASDASMGAYFPLIIETYITSSEIEENILYLNNKVSVVRQHFISFTYKY